MKNTVCTDKLALDGGTPVRTRPMPARKLFGEDEKAAVLALFDQAIAEGSHILGYNGQQEEAYCSEFSDYMGGGFTDGVNSGTNAVYVALRALELEPYSEVIVPPVSDPGGIMPVAMCNLIPVPADAAPGSYNTSAAQIEKRITSRTSAIMVAHIAGIPVDMDPVMALAKKHNLPVIEDAAQAHGGIYKGRMLGSIGTIAAFSTMFGKHHASGGQGGLVFTREKELYWKIRQHADRGKPFGLELETGAGAGVGAAASLGANFLAAINHNMDELHACIGRVQLRRLPSFLQQRRDFAQAIADACSSLACASLVLHPVCEGCHCGAKGAVDCETGCASAFWFLIFRFHQENCRVAKEHYVHSLKAEGLPFDPSYLHVPTRQPWVGATHVFGNGTCGLPWSAVNASPVAPPLPEIDRTDATHFRMSLHEGFGQAELEDIIAGLKKVDAAYTI